MFLTVTLNPALDKTLCVDRNAPQETLRARRVMDLAGGKGVNVARALRGLGSEVTALLPLGGHPGAHLAELARAEGIRVEEVPLAGQTRTAVTIQVGATGQYWHYLEPGPELTPAEQEAVLAALRRCLEAAHTVIVSGSLPCAAAAGLPGRLLAEARAREKRTALDSFGPGQLSALTAGDWLVKPNLQELEATLGEPLATGSARWAALERLSRAGTTMALLSLGAEGALAVAGGRRYRVRPPRVTEVNDLGGGDSMVAGICWAAAAGYTLPECLAWGTACGAANAEVWDPGALDRARVEALLPFVSIEAIGREE